MEKEQENILMKIRSSRACLGDGYQLFSANFRVVFRRTWPVALVFAVLAAVASALPVLVSPALTLPSMLLATICVIALLWVVRHILYKYKFFLPTGPVKAAAWLRHLGPVLLVGTVCLFIVAMLTLFTALPTIIMMAANWQSEIGVLNGDPAGMPSYVFWLSIVAFLIAGFIQAYVWTSVLFPLYLSRCSIAMQERDRQKFITNI